MGQEYFGGPEYFQEFDPEKFARELKAQAAARNNDTDSEGQAQESDSDTEPSEG